MSPAFALATGHPHYSLGADQVPGLVPARDTRVMVARAATKKKIGQYARPLIVVKFFDFS